jgi:hypothetical protein
VSAHDPNATFRSRTQVQQYIHRARRRTNQGTNLPHIVPAAFPITPDADEKRKRQTRNRATRRPPWPGIQQRNAKLHHYYDLTPFELLADPTGASAADETPDTTAFTGTVTIAGTIGATESADTSTFTGTHTAGPTGTIGATEAADTAGFTGTVAITGTIAVGELADSRSITGIETISGTIANTELADSRSITGTVSTPTPGTLVAAELADTAAFTGNVDFSSIVITGTLSAVEADDIVYWQGTRVGKVAGEFVPAGPIFRGSRRRRYFNPERNIVYGQPAIPPPEE